MIYTLNHINQIISSAYCCIGTIGDKIHRKLIQGSMLEHEETKLRLIFLYAEALTNWSQSDDGLSIYTNPYTISQRDKMLESIVSTCGCFNLANPVITINNDYWTNGYTENDEGSNSYNG